MNPRSHWRLGLIALLALVAALPGRAANLERPNIVLFLADDLGYGGLSCYGNNDYQTPQLDKLAAQGVRMTDFYVTTPGCAPSRAALMTGRYPFRSGMIRNPDPDHGLNDLGIPANEFLLSEALQAAGYATGCFGKWHLGHQPQFHPRRHGFDEYYGLLYSNSSRPAMLVENENIVEYPVIQANLTRQCTDRALRFVQANRNRPFFLYVPFSMPHYPLAASEDFYTPETPDDLYADVIRELDHSVGRILEELNKLGLERQTIALFTSDNGPWFGGDTGGLRGMKGSTFEGGVRVPLIARWTGRIPAGELRHQPSSIIDLLPTLLHVAGAKIPNDRVIDGVNLLPLLQSNTAPPDRALFSIVGNRVASVRRGKWKWHALRPGIPQWNDERFKPHKPDGVTILAPAEQYPGSRYPGPLSGTPAKPMMLFDLASDRAETRDLSLTHPEIAQRLRADCARLAAQIPQALKMPKPGPFRRVPGPRRITPKDPLPLTEVFPGK